MSTRKQVREFKKQHDKVIQETMPEFSEWCSALSRHLDNGTEYETAVEKALAEVPTAKARVEQFFSKFTPEQRRRLAEVRP